MPSRQLATDLYNATHRLVRTLRGRSRDLELSGERLSALLTLNSSGHASITDLAVSEHVAHSTMSRMVSALASDGLAQAYSNGADRRTSSIKLTPKGRRMAEKTLDEITDPLVLAIEALSEADKKTLIGAIKILETLLGSIKATN